MTQETDEVVSSREMFVFVEWMDRKFGVPLSQLEALVGPVQSLRDS